MREILFRGKSPDNGEWAYGVPVIAKDNIADKDIIVMVDNPNEIVPMEGLALFEQVDPETVGQYTGLTDKNGKKIFENDICRFDNDEPNEAERYTNYAIQWDIVNCRFVVVTADNCEDVLDGFFSEKSEIIANLHDNPELLEGK